MLDSLVRPRLDREEQEGKIFGVVPAIVTNNKDEEGLARIKVKFPWLSESDESYWARIATLMAGAERGSFFLPEVDDEVLVAFENGDINKPYMIGMLWNGKDKPPDTNENGKNDLRFIKSRSGHKIILDDKDGEEKITIIDKTEKRKIVFDVKEKLIDIQNEEADGKINVYSKCDIDITTDAKLNITAKDDITIKSDKNIILDAKEKISTKSGKDTVVDAGAKLDVKSKSSTKVEASSTMTLKSSGKFQAESSAAVEIKAGATGKFKATAPLDLESSAPVKVKGALATLESSGITTVKGSLVKIN